MPGSSGRLRAFAADERGQAMVDYALIALLVAIAAIVALSALSRALSANLQQTGNSLRCPNGVVYVGGTPQCYNG